MPISTSLTRCANPARPLAPVWPASAARRSALAVLAALLSLAGCSSASPAPGPGSLPPGVVEMVERGLAEAESDAQREVLSRARQTGTITEADWKEANHRYLQCLRDAGQDVELVVDGPQVEVRNRAGGAARPSGPDPVQQACYRKTAAYINEVYSRLHSGNSGSDPETLERALLACLVDQKVVPPGTTLDELRAKLAQEGGEYHKRGTELRDEFMPCLEQTVGRSGR